ncbi:MAG: hypothetical protein LBR22_10795 [Desulfovibrio sp.]|jgi:D-glycero-alpha-D-manno-heptose-7-phosphate kinase|nr:hypothetical protein [Desulfovibrio sp.]
MVITRTPFHINFLDGGSDIPEFYRQHGGAVLSASIDKYMFLSMCPNFFQDGYSLKYTETEYCKNIDEIHHPATKEIFKHYKIKDVNFTAISDIPIENGMKCSSIFTVGLINLCNAYNRTHITQEEIANQACKFKMNILNKKIGKQNQYSSTFGGLNYFSFNKDDTVTIKRLHIATDIFKTMQENLVLFYSGKKIEANTTRDVDTNFKNQTAVNVVKLMTALANKLQNELMHGNGDALGEIMKEEWRLKKEILTSPVDPEIAALHEKGLYSGAVGGKHIELGDRVYLLFYVKKQNHTRFRKAFKDMHEMPFRIDRKGTTLIYPERDRI